MSADTTPPRKGYSALICDGATGAIVRRDYPNTLWDKAAQLFYWKKDDNACDCNRRTEFLRGCGLGDVAIDAYEDAIEDHGGNLCTRGLFPTVLLAPDGTTHEV